MSRAPASFLRVYDASNGMIRVEMGGGSNIEAAVHQHLESGRDSVLHLRLADGATYRMFARDVRSWVDSTPAIRAASSAIDQMLDREQKRATRKAR